MKVILMNLFLFWASAAFILYTYLIYPVVIYVMSLLSPHRGALKDIDEGLPSITMIIVVHDEEERVEEKIEDCESLDYPEGLLEICFVSDGSTDGTNAILREKEGITFIEDDIQRGKPAQLNTAAARARGDIIVFSDVRQKYWAGALRKLARNFADEKIGAVSGELQLGETDVSTGRNIGLYWKYEKAIRKAEAAVDSTLGVSGSIYAVRRRLYEPIPDDTILDDIEIPLRIFRKGYRVVFDSEAVAADVSSSEMGREWNRKVRTLAGNFQLFNRNLWLFDPARNRIFFQTVSHKFFRLLIPYALVTLLVTSASAGGPFYRVFFSIQMIAYVSGIAALKYETLKNNRMLNLFSVFILLNAAAVAGLFRFLFANPDARWK